MPPHLHSQNAAEQAIQTFKNHFIAGLVFTHDNFPLHLWCQLLPQSILTLNFLQPSRINPSLLAQAQLHGQFDYNATPIAPPGTKVIVHIKPAVRKRLEPQGIDGWYVDQSKDHCRCYSIYLPQTQEVFHGDTVEFFPHNSRMLFRSLAENASVAATNLVNALQHPAPAAPYAHIGDQQMETLQKLAEFSRRNHPTPDQPTTTTRPSPTFRAPAQIGVFLPTSPCGSSKGDNGSHSGTCSQGSNSSKGGNNSTILCLTWSETSTCSRRTSP